MYRFLKRLLAAGVATPAVTTLGVLLSPAAHAQQAPVSLAEFSRQRIQHQRTLGYTLGGYALANIAVSGLAAGRTAGETKYFHRMNVYWNLVNLGIAGAGLLGARRQPAETLPEAVRRHEQIKRVLLFNAGLDVAYMMGGLYLLERAKNRPDQRDQLRGFGKSVLVQGGFLLAFDLVNYFVFRSRDKQQFELIGQAPLGAGIVLPIR